jgi:hypothetical protein
MDRINMKALLPRGRKDPFTYLMQAADVAVDIYTSDADFTGP